MTPLGNYSGEEITLQGITLWGRDAESFNDNSAGDFIDKLC